MCWWGSPGCRRTRPAPPRLPSTPSGCPATGEAHSANASTKPSGPAQLQHRLYRHLGERAVGQRTKPIQPGARASVHASLERTMYGRALKMSTCMIRMDDDVCVLRPRGRRKIGSVSSELKSGAIVKTCGSGVVTVLSVWPGGPHRDLDIVAAVLG